MRGPIKCTSKSNAANAHSWHEGSLVAKIETMAGPLGRALYRGILRDLARVWSAREIEDTPEFGDGSTPYLLGMAKVKDKVKILLDIDQVLSSQSLVLSALLNRVMSDPASTNHKSLDDALQRHESLREKELKK